MKKSRVSTLCTIAFLLAVAVYIVYQVVANLTQQIRTVDALEVTDEEIEEQIREGIQASSYTAEYAAYSVYGEFAKMFEEMD